MQNESKISREVEMGLPDFRAEFFELVPFNVAIIDKKYNIVAANKNFVEYFGQWSGHRCYEVCKKTDRPCSHCRVHDVFNKGEVIVSDESGIDSSNRTCHYVVHLAPVKDQEGNVTHVIEMSVDITNTGRYQREYNILFEKVPSYVSIIDKNYRIVRANQKFRDTFGEVDGKNCYEVYKKRKTMCKKCPAKRTFRDGKDHIATQVGLTSTGEEAHYIINTTALSRNEDGVQLVIEIATDITEESLLQEQLRQAHDFYATLIQNSADGILAVDNNWHTQIFNPAAKDILKWTSHKKPGVAKIRDILPEEFFSESEREGDIIMQKETKIRDYYGEEIPVRLNAIELKSRRHILGRVAFIEDLRNIKKLEREKLDAERLGAVGQTVAGLAHTIKNLLMGLEGGMYMVDTGLKKGDATRIMTGWEVLQRNFNKTTSLVKDFLSFAKGRLPKLSIIHPNDLVQDILDLYSDAAQQQGVELSAELGGEVRQAPLDRDGIEACVTNLVSNGIDAAMQREGDGGKVILRTYEEKNAIVIEVEDNGCGMDSEVIQKIFTTFFTTKGGKGTGLGLLTTRKIVQEHGGKIEVISEPDKGATFRIVLPRARLEMILEETYS